MDPSKLTLVFDYDIVIDVIGIYNLCLSIRETYTRNAPVAPNPTIAGAGITGARRNSFSLSRRKTLLPKAKYPLLEK